MNETTKTRKHIVLTSHPSGSATKSLPIAWGAPTAAERGPLIGTVTNRGRRNVIGEIPGTATGDDHRIYVFGGHLDSRNDVANDFTNFAPSTSGV